MSNTNVSDKTRELSVDELNHLGRQGRTPA